MDMTVQQSDKTSNDRHSIQDFRLIRLDLNIDESNHDYRGSVAQLRGIVNIVGIFDDVDQCVDYLTEIKDEKVFMIMSCTLGQRILPLIHDISQLYFIYLYSESRSYHEHWPKVKGVFTQVTPICESLKQTIRQCDHNSISMSFLPPSDNISNEKLNQLDQSFMYTQIFKEIMFDTEYNQQSIKDVTAYCREQYADNHVLLTNIDKFEREYHLKSPIWWYTYEFFLYTMLNRALRTQDVDTIINIGLFIRDLHRHIEQLHSIQSNNHQRQSFTVYRGQAMSNIEFSKMKKSQGGLLSFNNFLSTSLDRDVPLAFAESNGSNNPDLTMVGVLFDVTVDTSISTAPFAFLDTVSYYEASEQEVLFSMHTVFRIGEINQIDNHNRLWCVKLTLTDDNDQQLKALTERMREETDGPTEWHRLGQLLIKLAEYDKAQQVYTTLVRLIPDVHEKAFFYGQLGWIKNIQGDYAEAISFYKKTIAIYEEHFALNYLVLATYYNNIGSVYGNIGEYSEALSFYEKALEIEQNTLPSNHPDLATSYSNIGSVCKKMGEYSRAFSLFEKALDIRQKTLPENHPELALLYNDIGMIYHTLREYPNALLFFEKALEIWQNTSSLNHINLATSYNNIGLVYFDMDEHSKALPLYEKALEIYHQILPPNLPLLATAYNNVGLLHSQMNEFSEALSSYEKALEIYEKTLSPNHVDFASFYSNIGSVYYKMGEHSKALSFFERAMGIAQQSLPPNHPILAVLINNIEVIRE